MYFGAVAVFSGFVGNIIHDMLELGNAARKADDIRKYFDLEDEQMDDGEGTKELKYPLEIEFRDVSFSYKSNDEDKENVKIFEHFNLKINSGEKIALVGETGKATGPHLHFEIRRDKNIINPEYILKF